MASVRVGPSPRTLYLHRDRLTSVVATTLGGGVAGATYRYGAYGALEATAGDAGDAASELGYAGTLRLTGGLLWMGARVYDPVMKVFLQPDPLAPHSYAYAGGDPVNRWDPTGLAPDPKKDVPVKCVDNCGPQDPPKPPEPDPQRNNVPYETVITAPRERSPTPDPRGWGNQQAAAEQGMRSKSGAGMPGGKGPGESTSRLDCPPGQKAVIIPTSVGKELRLGVNMTGDILGIQAGLVALLLVAFAPATVPASAAVVTAWGGGFSLGYGINGLVGNAQAAAAIGQLECATVPADQ
jgi:RHS repeat-associated protein